MIEHENLPYSRSGGRTLLLDLFLPDHAPRPLPVVLWIVGGGWTNCPWKAHAPKWLTQFGYAVATAQYTVSGQAIAPANVHDCKAAIRYLRAIAPLYGLDPQRLGLFGASAGGHLAALLAVSSGVAALEGSGGNPGYSSAVQSACDFCGPTDLTRIARPEIRRQFPVLYDVTAQYLGGPVEDRSDLARLMSPLTYVTSPGTPGTPGTPKFPPIFIIHGKVDSVVPVEESLIFEEALRKVGADVSLRVLEGADHSWDENLTKEDIAAFFKRTL